MAGGKTSRGSPGGFKYHKGGVFSRYSKREGSDIYYIRFKGPDGRRKKETAGTRKSDAVALLVDYVHERTER